LGAVQIKSAKKITTNAVQPQIVFAELATTLTAPFYNGLRIYLCEKRR
jgi:hypothetical protein